MSRSALLHPAENGDVAVVSTADASTTQSQCPRCCVYLPICGLLLVSKKSSLEIIDSEKIERLLQLLGLLNGLMLTTAFGTMGGSQPEMSSPLNVTCPETMCFVVPCCSFDLMYLSCSLFMLEMLLIFITYYTVLIIGSLTEEELNSWWKTSGKYNILLQMSIIALGSMAYWTAVFHNLKGTFVFVKNSGSMSNKIFFGITFILALIINYSVVAARSGRRSE
jgi:hypothetical protein